MILNMTTVQETSASPTVESGNADTFGGPPTLDPPQYLNMDDFIADPPPYSINPAIASAYRVSQMDLTTVWE
jgi:hypothetical protein